MTLGKARQRLMEIFNPWPIDMILKLMNLSKTIPPSSSLNTTLLPSCLVTIVTDIRPVAKFETDWHQNGIILVI